MEYLRLHDRPCKGITNKEYVYSPLLPWLSSAQLVQWATAIPDPVLKWTNTRGNSHTNMLTVYLRKWTVSTLLFIPLFSTHPSGFFVPLLIFTFWELLHLISTVERIKIKTDVKVRYQMWYHVIWWHLVWLSLVCTISSFLKSISSLTEVQENVLQTYPEGKKCSNDVRLWKGRSRYTKDLLKK